MAKENKIEVAKSCDKTECAEEVVNGLPCGPQICFKHAPCDDEAKG